MATRRNDPDLPTQARRMRAAGVNRVTIARVLRVHLTTVDWYVRTGPIRRETAEVFSVVHGEKESLPPRQLYLRCPICQGRMDPAAPHDHTEA